MDAREIPAGRSALKADAKPDDPKTFAAYPEKKTQVIQAELVFAEEADLTEEQSGALDDAEVAVATRAGAQALDDATALHEVKHFRLERVGLVYLWPDLG